MPGYVVPDDLPSNLMVYAKMLKVGLATQSVLNKMRMDGIPEEMFHKHLDPNRAPEPAKKEEDDEFASDDEKEADNPLYDAGGDGQAAAADSTMLAIEESKVDMTGMRPMPVKKTLIVINAFLAESVTFLNRFVATCEDRLHLVDRRIEKMKLRMIILENNLNSIEWLRKAPAEDAPKPVQKPVEGEEQAAAAPQEGETPSGQGADEGAEPQQSPGEALKADGRYRLYFKMLSVRVPANAVRNKMLADKVPGDIIDQILQHGKP